MSEKREVDVCIVGAGFAGLVAARDLVAGGPIHPGGWEGKPAGYGGTFQESAVSQPASGYGRTFEETAHQRG